MTSRRYIKRVWRVPKDRGALEYLAALVTKALVKHGWPARFVLDPITEGFLVHEQGRPVGPLPSDFQSALEAAVRITARTYRVDVAQYDNWVGLNRQYAVTVGGHFKES